jgi:type II secretory pathway component GspD/PulD (secretin)
MNCRLSLSLRSAITLCTLALALPLTLTQPLHAQEKSDRPEASSTTELRTSNTTGADTVRAWEEKLHTTDCSRMPTHAIGYDCMQLHDTTRFIPLHNVTQQNDANEILTAARNIADPMDKLYLVASENVIVVGTYPQEADRIETLVHTLDVARKSCRLTFTLIDTEAGQRVGVSHYTVLATDGQRTSTKQGSKIPVATSSSNPADGMKQENYTYLDIGMNFDVTPASYDGGVALRMKVEQSSVAETHTSLGDRDPIIRQTVYEGAPMIPYGKSVSVGGFDLPNSAHHLEIEVLAEPLK